MLARVALDMGIGLEMGGLVVAPRQGQ